MTRNEARQAVKVLQAYINGKTIQESRKGPGIWRDRPSPFFGFDYYDYRVKPEPGAWLVHRKALLNKLGGVDVVKPIDGTTEPLSQDEWIEVREVVK